MGARRDHDPEPGRARAAGRDRQLVRAPPGQALRRGPGDQRDGLEPRDPLRQPQDARRAARRPPRRARGRAGRDPALRPGPRDHALRRGRGRRARRGLHRPQHGLPGAEGDEDRRGRRADPRPGHGGRRRARRRRGLRPPGHGQAPGRAQAGRRRGLRRPRAGSSRTPASPASPSIPAPPPCAIPARRTTSWPRGSSPSCRSRSWSAAACRARSTSAPCSSPPAARRSCSPAARSATRGCSRRCWARATRSRRTRRSWPSGAGSSTAPPSISGPSARRATCASSTPGTSTALGRGPRAWRPRCSRRSRSPPSGPSIDGLAPLIAA